MAKRATTLQYSIGAENLSGHITKIGADHYRAFLTSDGRITHRRDLTRVEYLNLDERMHAAGGGANPEYEFASIWPLREYVIAGRFDVPDEEWALYV